MLKKIFKILGGASEAAGSFEQEKFKYCPLCKDEFRADIETCANCSVALVDTLPKSEEDFFAHRRAQKENKKISPGDKVVTIQQGPLLEVKRMRTLLTKAGIPSLIASEDGASQG